MDTQSDTANLKGDVTDLALRCVTAARALSGSGNTVGIVTCTRSSGGGVLVAVSTTLRCRRIQPNIRLAFIPCRRATAATEAPGVIASARIYSFSSVLRYRRFNAA